MLRSEKLPGICEMLCFFTISSTKELSCPLQQKALNNFGFILISDFINIWRDCSKNKRSYPAVLYYLNIRRIVNCRKILIIWKFKVYSRLSGLTALENLEAHFTSSTPFLKFSFIISFLYSVHAINTLRCMRYTAIKILRKSK